MRRKNRLKRKLFLYIFVPLDMRINNGNHLAPVCTEILLHLDRIGEEALVPLFKKVYFPE